MNSPRTCLKRGNKWGRLACWTGEWGKWRQKMEWEFWGAGQPGFHRDLLFPSLDK